jgi:DnaK suppressor protein
LPVATQQPSHHSACGRSGSASISARDIATMTMPPACGCNSMMPAVRRSPAVVRQHGAVDVGATLLAARAQTLAQIEALAADLADIKSAAELVATDDEHDPEGATIAFERARVDALLTQARDHLLAIDRAEQGLAAGSYGRCVRCGQPIGSERLAARPTAETCIACA